MELAVSMWSVHKKFFHEGWTVMDFLQFCYEHSISNVELLDVFWKNQGDELPQVQAFLRQHRMTVAAYAVSNDYVQESENKRKAASEVILDGIEMAQQLDTEVVRVFAGDLKPGYDFQNGENYIVEGFRDVVATAQRNHKFLALENHGKLAGRGEQVKHIIQAVESDFLKSTFDIGNFVLVGQTPQTAFQELKALIAHVHVKDLKKGAAGQGFSGINEEWFVPTACGAGELPLPAIIQEIQKSAYNGYLSLEYEGDGDEVSGVLESMNYLRDFVD